MSYVTQEYDFIAAIGKHLQPGEVLDIIKVTPFLRTQDPDEKWDSAIVDTASHGQFYCQSFEDKDANVYMHVSPLK